VIQQLSPRKECSRPRNCEDHRKTLAIGTIEGPGVADFLEASIRRNDPHRTKTDRQSWMRGMAMDRRKAIVPGPERAW